MRGALEKWFDAQGVRPRLVGEFEDSALMEVAASGALGFTTVHTVVDHAALKHYGLKVIAKVEECGSDFLRDHRRTAGEAPGSRRDHRARIFTALRVSAIAGALFVVIRS